MYLLRTQTHILTTHQSCSDVGDWMRWCWPLCWSPAKRAGADQHPPSAPAALTQPASCAASTSSSGTGPGQVAAARAATGRWLPAASAVRWAEAQLRRPQGRELPPAVPPPLWWCSPRSTYGRRKAAPRDSGSRGRATLRQGIGIGHQEQICWAFTHLGLK